MGLVINDFNFGLAMMTPTNVLDFERYFALEASANSVQLVGIPDVTAIVSNVLVEINESTPSVAGLPLFPVVDFATTPQFANEELALFDTNHTGQITLGELASLAGAGDFTWNVNSMATYTGNTTVLTSTEVAAILNTDTGANNTVNGNGGVTVGEAADLLGGTAAAMAAAKAADPSNTGFISPDGMAINTGGTPVYLDMNSPLILAQAQLILDVDSIILLTGSFAFELGPTQNVQLTGGTSGTANTATVTTLTVGASNVSAFIGWNGQYDYSTPYGPATLVGANGGSPIGLELSDLNLGLFLGVSLNPINPEAFFAMNFSVGSLQTVGLSSFIQFNATLAVNINIGASFTTPGAVINFQASFPSTTAGGSAGYEVNTGNPSSPVLLNYTGFLINVELVGELIVGPAGSPIAALQGIFYLDVTDSSFQLFVSASLLIGPDIDSTSPPLLNINALGVVDINANGPGGSIVFAADLNVSLSLNVPGLSLDVEAAVLINTSGQQQQVQLPSLITNFLQNSSSPLAANVLASLVKRDPVPLPPMPMSLARMPRTLPIRQPSPMCLLATPPTSSTRLRQIMSPSPSRAVSASPVWPPPAARRGLWSVHRDSSFISM